jgi:hypothetical protein
MSPVALLVFDLRRPPHERIELAGSFDNTLWQVTRCLTGYRLEAYATLVSGASSDGR